MNAFYTIRLAQASLPRLTLAQRVVDKMVGNALIYETETGESLVGFAIKNLGRTEPDLYVLDTIAPDDSAIRRGAYFEQGDDLQGDIFNWWFDNWNGYRQLRRGSYGNAVGAKWDTPLVHLGDWHKHPGTLIQPSWGDTDTAREHIFDDEEGSPQLLAILATVWDRERDRAFAESESSESLSNDPQPIRVPIDDQLVVRLDCWYMSRHTRRFVRLTPTVVADKVLPSLPILGWHLTEPERMRSELDVLSKAGYSVGIDQYDADSQPPLEICLTLARPGGPKVLTVVTHADYPAAMPTIRTAPMSAMKDVPEDADLFTTIWKQSEPLPKELYPTWDWNTNRMILDVVRDVEAKLAEGSAVK